MPSVEAIFTANTQQPPPPAWRSRIGAALADPNTVARVILADNGAEKGAVMGYVMGEVRSWEFGSEPAGWVFAVGVSPQVQGSGMGRELLAAALGAFAELGVPSVRTMVRRDDVSVLRFFRGAGFAAGPYTELELELPEEGA